MFGNSLFNVEQASRLLYNERDARSTFSAWQRGREGAGR